MKPIFPRAYTREMFIALFPQVGPKFIRNPFPEYENTYKYLIKPVEYYSWDIAMYTKERVFR